MRLIFASLALVGLAGLGIGAFALVAGLTTDVTAGVEGRPFIYWMIAAAGFVVGMISLPELVAWFVRLEIPAWHRDVIARSSKDGSLEHSRSGRTMLALARSTEPRRRPSLAGRIFGYGLFNVVLSIPMPLMFGVAAMRPGNLRLEEAAPLIAALWVPAIWVATLLLRSKRSAGHFW